MSLSLCLSLSIHLSLSLSLSLLKKSKRETGLFYLMCLSLLWFSFGWILPLLLILLRYSINFFPKGVPYLRFPSRYLNFTIESLKNIKISKSKYWRIKDTQEIQLDSYDNVCKRYVLKIICLDIPGSWW